MTFVADPSMLLEEGQLRRNKPRSRCGVVWLLRHCSVGLFAVGASGCVSWPDRPPISAVQQNSAQIAGVPGARIWADAPANLWIEWRDDLVGQRRSLGFTDHFEILAISSGSDKGAYSAGFLLGWTESGTRPQFAIVSGVSTGALIAPFAFLGSDYDGHLRKLYTQIKADQVYKSRPIEGLLSGPALADTQPLAELIARYADEHLVAAVAQEHRRGRRLLVQTTNLDAERGVIWDMGAIAVSERPDKVVLFQQVLLASSSIPGLFPPVLIEASADTATPPFREMHVDGGTTSSIFAIPPAVLFGSETERAAMPGRVTILYNGTLSPSHRITEPRTLRILRKALSVSIKEADRRTVSALAEFTRRSKMSLQVFEIDEASVQDEPLFNPEYMRELFEKGRAQGSVMPHDRDQWKTPGGNQITPFRKLVQRPQGGEPER